MLYLRSFVFNVTFYICLVSLLTISLPTLFLKRQSVLKVACQWGRMSVWLLEKICGTKVEFRGLENIPSGPVIVAPKHQSFFEIFAFMTYFSDFTFILKRELTRIPLFGWYALRSGQIPVDREEGIKALAYVAQAAKLVLQEQRKVFIFPEGTRYTPWSPPDYKRGIAYIYSKTGVPCLPVALNSGLFWPRHSFLRRPGTIVIEFLPIIPAGLPRNEFLKLLEDRIEEATNKLMLSAEERVSK